MSPASSLRCGWPSLVAIGVCFPFLLLSFLPSAAADTTPKKKTIASTGKATPAAHHSTHASSHSASSTAAKAPAKKGAAGTGSTARRSSGSKSSASKSSSKSAGRRRAAKSLVAARQTHPSNERYSEIQNALMEAGYLEGPANGVWGPSSVTALQQFQQDNGIEPTGKIDSLSLIKLNLGPKYEKQSDASSGDAPAAK